MMGFNYKYVQSKIENAFTIVLFHGTGGNENSMIEMAANFGNEFNFLSPRGKENENGLLRYFKRLAIGVLDVEDLKYRAIELTIFIKEASVIHHFNPEKVIILGYSNGANVAGGIILLRPELFSIAVLMHPMIPFTPTHKLTLAGKTILVTSGKNDHTMEPGETTKWIKLLESYGATVEHYEHASGHTVTDNEIEAVSNFLSRYK